MLTHKIFNSLLALALSIGGLSVPISTTAQTYDSTSIPVWTAASPTYSPRGATPPGTQCGASTQGSVWWDWNYAPCQGHNPKYSCPAGYYTKLVAEQDGVYYYSCVNY